RRAPQERLEGDPPGAGRAPRPQEPFGEGSPGLWVAELDRETAAQCVHVSRVVGVRSHAGSDLPRLLHLAEMAETDGPQHGTAVEVRAAHVSLRSLEKGEGLIEKGRHFRPSPEGPQTG